MIRVHPARLWEAVYVGANLRSEDAREVMAASGRHPTRVLAESFKSSRETLALRLNDDPSPFALCGAVDDPSVTGLGVVWMLCTPGVAKVALSMAKIGPTLAKHLGRHYPQGMHNLAHKQNYLHVRWCQLSGFVELGERDLNGHTFIHIYRPGDV